MAELSFLDLIRRGGVVMDGAMGTELYKRGHFINKPFEGVNLSDPALVERIHREYVASGVDAIETNTFAANRFKLRQVGLEEQHDALNRAGVELARHAADSRAHVVASIGPIGARLIAKLRLSDDDIRSAFHDQAEAILAAGPDAIALETFSSLSELELALEAVRPLTELPVLALASFTGGGATADGASPDQVVRSMIRLGADVTGANCADGPLELYAIAERMINRGIPIAIMPNAGYPRALDGRMIYMATPEYFGVFARRLFKLGVAIVGGCCGTSPEHSRSMVAAGRMMAGGTIRIGEARKRDSISQELVPILDPVPFAERSRLAAKIAGDEGFVVSVEVNPPAGLDPSRAIRGAQMLKDAGVDVVNIADGPRATVRMSNWALALKIREATGMESILHLCMRDRNLLGLQGDVLAYHALGLNNLVVITGDPPKMGDYPDATAVFDLDSIGTLRMISDFNRGIALSGGALGGQTQFALATGAEPAALDRERELRRTREKIEAGAEFIMTQPVYDADVLLRFLDDLGPVDIPILVGLMPLASQQNAEFLHNEVPGMQVPSHIRERMAAHGRGAEARAEGVRIAQEMLLAVQDRVRGAYIMPPFGRYEAAIEILEVVGYERPAAWRENWRS